MTALEALCNAAIGLLVSWAATFFVLGYSAVRVATNRILDADLRESGEPAEVVRAAYWRAG